MKPKKKPGPKPKPTYGELVDRIWYAIAVLTENERTLSIHELAAVQALRGGEPLIPLKGGTESCS